MGRERRFKRSCGTCLEETTSTCWDNRHHNQRTFRNKLRLITCHDTTKSPYKIRPTEPSSSSGIRADTSRPVFQRDEGSRMRFMSDDQPSSAAANPVKRLAMKTRTYSTSTPCETHTATIETDPRWSPKPHQPKSDSRMRSLRLPISFRRSPNCATVLRTKLSRWSLHVSV